MDEKFLKPNLDFKQEAEMYKNIYLKLFNAVTDALTALNEKDDVSKVSYILKQAQCACEEIYTSV